MVFWNILHDPQDSIIRELTAFLVISFGCEIYSFWFDFCLILGNLK